MFCISINHKSADVSIREKLAFKSDVQVLIMHEICNLKSAGECIVLCTCNRTEIYFTGDASLYEDIIHILAAHGNVSVEELSPHIMRFDEERALLHLFKVASGIDSMVIGEDEILGQLKNAYISAKNCGTAGSGLNIIFQSAIACAKKIKTETELSRTSVSTATLAANEAAKSGEAVNVLLIGSTGEIGMRVLKNLLSHKNVSVTATLRTHGGPGLAVKQLTKTVNYSERYRFMDDADCIISATSSPHYTVTLREYQKCIKTQKNRLFIDLAVPPDIDSGIAAINGVRMIGIDYFEKLAHEHNLQKLSSVDAANEIIRNETDTLKKELMFRDFLPEIENFRAALKNHPVEELLYKLKSGLTSSQLNAVLEILKNYGG